MTACRQNTRKVGFRSHTQYTGESGVVGSYTNRQTTITTHRSTIHVHLLAHQDPQLIPGDFLFPWQEHCDTLTPHAPLSSWLAVTAAAGRRMNHPWRWLWFLLRNRGQRWLWVLLLTMGINKTTLHGKCQMPPQEIREVDCVPYLPSYSILNLNNTPDPPKPYPQHMNE